MQPNNGSLVFSLWPHHMSPPKLKCPSTPPTTRAHMRVAHFNRDGGMERKEETKMSIYRGGRRMEYKK